jgi:hypothetical protein
MQSIETWGDLLAALNSLTSEQLRQPVQIAESPADCKPVEMQCGIAIGTVGEFEFSGSRSTHDNRYHADDVCLLVDGNSFAEDGAIAYEMKTHKTNGRPVIRHVPLYGKDGPTPREAQMSPNERKEFPAHVASVVRKRGDAFEELIE